MNVSPSSPAEHDARLELAALRPRLLLRAEEVWVEAAGTTCLESYLGLRHWC